MLKMMRDFAHSWVLKGLLILVILTFIFIFGGYSFFREKQTNYVAKVGKTTIEWHEYESALNNQIKRLREAYGPSYTDKMIEELHLKDKVLDNLINQVLIRQEAKRLGLTASDEEVWDSIETVPAFQEDGRFSPEKFEWVLRSNDINQEEFWLSQKDSLLSSKVVDLIKINSRISEEEVLGTYLNENERINLSFLKISPDSFKNKVSVNEIDIKDYDQKHQEEFRIPTSIQVQYLLFRPSDFEGKIQVTQDDTKRYYDSHKESFKIPKQIRVSNILIKTGPQDSSSIIEEKKKKVEAILEKAKKTKDFASLAKQYSEGENASKGGQLGWIQKGMMDAQTESILFSKKAGEVSIMPAKDGFYIFKTEEVKEEKQKPLEEVKNQIHQTLMNDKAKAEASRKADDAFYSLFKSRDLEGYAREKNIPIKTTDFFKDGDTIPEIGRNPLFYSSAISLKPGEISAVVDIPPNFYIQKLMSKKESRIPSLDEVKDKVTQKVVELKAEEKARQTSEEIFRQIQTGKNFKEVAKEKGYSLEETGFFIRAAQMIPKIGPAQELIGSLASMTETNPVPKEVIRTKDGYFVVRLSDYEPADRRQYELVKKSLEKRLNYQKQEEAFQNWLNQLRSKTKIDINKDLIKG